VKVALVHDYLMQGMRGAERVLLTLHAIYPEAPVYTLMYDPESFGDALPDWEVRTSFLQPLRRMHKRLLWLMPRATESLDLSGYDVVISSSSAWVKSVIPRNGAVSICYCYSPPAARGPVRPSLPALRRWDARTAQRVHHYVAISEVVRQRIRKYFGRDSHIIYPPVETSRFAPSTEQDDYFLIVSRLNAQKCVDLAVEAFNELKLPLLVIGDGPELEKLKSMAGPTVTLAGQRSDEEVAERMARCRAFLMPQEEDFGIAAVEAQAAGRPVIAYRAGGATETVVEGDTGLFFGEHTPASLAEAVRRFEGMSFSQDGCRANALTFDTSRFVREWRAFVASKCPQEADEP
jgi:glycosyltransferase involved in cell wall biosynthesis